MGVVAFTPDGSIIASESGGLRRFDLEGGSELIRAEPWKKRWDFALSVDGRFLLSAGGDMGLGISEVVFEDLETGVSRVLASHGQQVMSVALDPAARRAITADSSGVIRVGPVTGEAPHWLMGHEGPVLSLAVHPNGTWIASGGEDGNHSALAHARRRTSTHVAARRAHRGDPRLDEPQSRGRSRGHRRLPDRDRPLLRMALSSRLLGG